jgi:hypothetical protein
VAVLLAAALGVAARCEAAPPPAALHACTLEREDAARLACFDREMQRLETLAAKSYGLSGEQQGKPPVVVMSGVVGSLKLQSDGRTVITLADGAVWIQGEAYEALSLHAGDRVTVKPGLLGAFYLYPPQGSPTRVRRLR